VLSSIFIALFQAVAGDPSAAATEATAEAPATSTEAAPRTERRRVCRTYEAGTGGRLSQRRCRYVEVPVRDTEPTSPEAADTSAAASVDSTDADAGDAEAGGAPVAASPAPSPQ
jgi:hypothetical protein